MCLTLLIFVCLTLLLETAKAVTIIARAHWGTKPGTQGTHNFEQWNKFTQKTKNATAFEIAGKLSSEETNSSAKLIEYVKEIISNQT